MTIATLDETNLEVMFSCQNKSCEIPKMNENN